ncbi:hypothetical protein ACFQVA_30165 [Actinomadura keratinilytica]
MSAFATAAGPARGSSTRPPCRVTTTSTRTPSAWNWRAAAGSSRRAG